MFLLEIHQRYNFHYISAQLLHLTMYRQKMDGDLKRMVGSPIDPDTHQIRESRFSNRRQLW